MIDSHFSDGERGSAVRSKLNSAIARVGRRRPYGTRIIAGRTACSISNVGGATYELTIALPADAVAVQPIFAASKNASGATGAPSMLARVAAVGDLSAAASDAATWSSVTVGGLTTWPLTAAAAAGRRAYVIGDILPIKTVARTDGGTLRLVAIRAYLASVTDPLCILGNGGSDTYAGWETEVTGRVFKLRRATGQYAFLNETGYGAVAGSTNTSPIIGLRWYAKSGYVTTIMGLGDSNIEGRITGLIGRGWPFDLAASLAPADGSVVEYLSMGWSGQTVSQWTQNFRDLLAAGLVPDVAVIPVGTCNAISGTIDLDEIATIRGHHRGQMGLCVDAGIVSVTATWQPYINNPWSWGASDSYRRDLNTQTLADPTLAVADIATPLSGADDGTGMIQLAAAYNLDGTHTNAAGNSVAATAARPVVTSVCPWLA